MFKTVVTPRFGDIDGLKHVNNTVLAVWFEQARNPVFRMFTPDLDLSYENWKLIMVRTEFDFLCEMYYGENVEILSFIEKVGNSSFTMGHEAWQNGKLKVRGKAVVVHYDFIGKKSVPIPESIRSQLMEHLMPHGTQSENNNK
jgi:acyl-CoA thioester hydrolase